METSPFENPWLKKNRLLTKVLLISVSLNIGLFTKVFFINDSKLSTLESKTKMVLMDKTNGEVLSSFFKMQFRELSLELKDKTNLQDGYLKRDLALSCLVNFYYLNLEKAIPGKILQKRKLTFIHNEGGESFQVTVFPNLDDLDFALVEKFLKEERWPFTTEGLFLELKKNEIEDLYLKTAFFATPEFHFLYSSLKRINENVSKDQVLNFLIEGEFKDLDEWYKQASSHEDNLVNIRKFFQSYIEIGSSKAAELWIGLDSEHILRKLSDLELSKIIKLISKDDLSISVFLRQILCSVRSDEIRKAAALKLYQFCNEEPPLPYDHQASLKRFLPKFFTNVEPLLKLEKVKMGIVKKHLVTEGDSLWKIAKKYNVTINEIRKANEIQKDKLKPGQEIIIPEASKD
jgi:LysM repeat protein